MTSILEPLGIGVAVQLFNKFVVEKVINKTKALWINCRQPEQETEIEAEQTEQSLDQPTQISTMTFIVCGNITEV